MAASTHRHFIVTVVFTSCLLILIAFAIGVTNPAIAGMALISVVALATVFHFVLPGGGFFAAVFANAIGFYTCVYVFFISMNFARASHAAERIGFVLPLLGFLLGVLIWRRAITQAVRRESEPPTVGLWRAAVWLVPLALIGASSFIAPLERLEPRHHDMTLIGAMAVIAVVAVLAARDIATFLLDTGLLFESFFASAAKLAKPAFALLTCYSLLAIIFGCVYTLLDRYSAAPNFHVVGTARQITFAEALYFSVTTLSTVGYGDIGAIAPVARILVASEIFCGLLLIIFGVEAILSSSRRR